ncbi:MAG TPA: hypothetical protein VIL32_15515 [Steroidobacteraceae bacterium]
MPDERPGQPTPDDPRTREPIHDPPVHPEHDPPEPPPKRAKRNVNVPDAAPNDVIPDETESNRGN